MAIVGHVDAGAASEHNQVNKRVGAEAISAVHRNAGHFASRVQTGENVIGGVESNSAVDVRRYATHRIVGGRLNRHRLADRVNAQVGARKVSDVG